MIGAYYIRVLLVAKTNWVIGAYFIEVPSGATRSATIRKTNWVIGAYYIRVLLVAKKLIEW